MKSTNVCTLVIFLLYSFINASYECIGLGERCTVAAALEAFDLRKAAYPFDWIISEFQSTCNVLEADFEDFLNPDYFSIRSDQHGIINKYGLVFVHDFPTVGYNGDLQIDAPITEGILRPDWIDTLGEIQKKYLRRIERFRNVCRSNKKIYFIRHYGITSKKEAIVLRDILQQHYPDLDFTLVIAGNNSSFAEPWNIPSIKNYYLKETAAWNDVKEWETIFTDLGLITEVRKANLQDKMDSYYNKYNGE